MRRTGLTRKSWPRQASNPPTRRPRRDTGPSKAVRDLVKKRADHSCEICGRYLATGEGEVHHRHGRQMGGTRRPWINLASNLLYLCPTHHLMVTDTKGNRPEYELAGWLVREGIDPAGVPVRLAFGRPPYLTNDGGHSATKPREEAA